jgi:tryptophan synthase alpha chain
MSRLHGRFISLRRQGRKALIAYITGGYPSLKQMDRVARDLERAGADVVEIGVPFSDPIADGPTIQFSSQKALEKGVSLSDILRWVSRFRKRSELPVVLMSYLNPIHRMGYRAFARAASSAGVDGLIVPDLIPEEAGSLQEVLEPAGIDLIFLVAPTTPPDRRTYVSRQSRGFLYAVSLTGVTGARRDLPPGLRAFLEPLRRESPIPVAVGFGISQPAQARALASFADGIIVGSALIERLRKGQSVYPFVRSLRLALDKHGTEPSARSTD